jgi:alpha-L-fucosidase
MATFATAKSVVSSTVLLLSCFCAALRGNSLTASQEVVEAWKDMRFGMFLCWGPASLTGKEIGWSRQPPPYGKDRGFRCALHPRKDTTPTGIYDSLHKQWNPNAFDAEAWATVAMVYYSQPDWYHPDYLGEHHERYIRYLHGQIREILTNYGRIDGLWFDNLRGVSPQTAKLWEAERLFTMARSIQPHLIINNRCGLPGDYDTPEQHVGRFQDNRPWESCITLGTQWAWKPNDRLKTPDEAIRMLVSCVVGDGNLALNTNPVPDGQIEPRQVETFRQIGRWMSMYGESIYSTRGGPFLAPAWEARKFGAARKTFQLSGGRWWGGSTHKGNTVYLHVLRWPKPTIVLPDIGRSPAPERSAAATSPIG